MILLVIDVQTGLDDPAYGERSNPLCEERIAWLVNSFRSASHPVIYTRHCSLRPGSPLAPDNPGSQIKAVVKPLDEELVFTKTTNSAFKTREFAAELEQSGLRELAIVGMATDACVTATAREAKDLGYAVTVVSDGCATFARRSTTRETYSAELVQQVSLAALAASGMRVCTAAELLGDSATLPISCPRPA